MVHENIRCERIFLWAIYRQTPRNQQVSLCVIQTAEVRRYPHPCALYHHKQQRASRFVGSTSLRHDTRRARGIVECFSALQRNVAALPARDQRNRSRSSHTFVSRRSRNVTGRTVRGTRITSTGETTSLRQPHREP